MSTFGGKLEEIPFISIDRFDDINLGSKAFFLSHCHTDHMYGLYELDKREELLRTLKVKQNVFIYLSSQSKVILDRWMKEFKYFTRGLDIYEENYIDIPGEEPLKVSLIPAGHCPGSVMFLFEGIENILYTGDIRIRAKDLEKCKILRNVSKELKKIHHIYLDTTFFSKSYMNFPSRTESIEEFIKQINNWISVSSSHKVNIKTCAKYGYETLFIEIHKALKMPICINKHKYDTYKHFPEMDNVIICEVHNPPTQIHSMCYLHNYADVYKKNIKPCAYSWKKFNLGDTLKGDDGGLRKVCYSTHCSYSELRDILKLLKPAKITPCVVEEKFKSELYLLIDEILDEIHNENHNSKSSSDEELHTDWAENPFAHSSMTNNSDSDSSNDFGFLDSPEMKRKRQNSD